MTAAAPSQRAPSRRGSRGGCWRGREGDGGDLEVHEEEAHTLVFLDNVLGEVEDGATGEQLCWYIMRRFPEGLRPRSSASWKSALGHTRGGITRSAGNDFRTPDMSTPELFHQLVCSRGASLGQSTLQRLFTIRWSGGTTLFFGIGYL